MVAGRISTTHKNRTYESTTGPDICLYRKSEGKEPNSATWARDFFSFSIDSVNWRSGIRMEGYMLNGLSSGKTGEWVAKEEGLSSSI